MYLSMSFFNLCVYLHIKCTYFSALNGFTFTFQSLLCNFICVFMHDKSKQTSKIIIHTLSAFPHLPLHLCLRSISYSSNISSRFLKKDPIPKAWKCLRMHSKNGSASLQRVNVRLGHFR